MSSRSLVVFALLFASATLGGCSSKPAESDARRSLEQKIQRNSSGLIKLNSFSKTNGKDMEFAGVKMYEMEWVANLEVLGDCLWNKDNFVAVPKQEGLGRLLHIDKQDASRGQRIDLTGKTTFEKTEKGWRAMQ